MKRIAILGSTGSVGQSALSVIEAHPDRLSVVGLAAGENAARLAGQVIRHRPRIVAVASDSALEDVRARLSAAGEPDVEIAAAGADGLTAVATHPDVDIVLCASAGTVALDAVLAASRAAKTIALANKEVLVMAGRLMMESARAHDATILPVDSEHNAIHQCVHGRRLDDVRRLILTASGGPFRGWSAERLESVTPADALAHPTWRMGRKITVDSATMMNKGLEVIEARWLFEVPPARIDVIVHPQSIVHSLVELTDGSVIAQLGVTDMRLPIQYAFSYPERWDGPLPALDLAASGPLAFEEADVTRFPCLSLAYRALNDEGGVLPVVLNAANEVAVEAFLEARLPFPRIAAVIEEALGAAGGPDAPRDAASLAGIREIDRWARRFSTTLVTGVESRL